MSKKVRDYLFYLFVIVFVLATVIISLYASGYKFNLSWPPKFNRLLLKTGMLIVDSNPSGADIYLNDRQVTSHSILPWEKKHLTTAAKVKNILPGEYSLRIEREGYWPFKKKINIYSGQTTFAENINLFRSDLPFLVSPAAAGPLELSGSKKYLYVGGNQKIITLKDGAEKTIQAELSTIRNGSVGQWLKNSDRLLLDGWLIETGKNNPVNYRAVIGLDAINWHYEENSNRLYYQHKDSLSYFDIDDKTGQLVLSADQIIDYYPLGDNIFLIIKQDKKIFLRRYELATGQITSLAALPTAGAYHFTADQYGRLELYDQTNRTLYLINPQALSENLSKIADAISWQWLDENTILYNNSWEIHSFDLKTNNVSLITRVAEEITKIIWHQDKNYLVFATDKTLNTIDRENGTITVIFKTEKILSPVLDEKGDSLYFWAKIGQQEGVYRIMLQ
ncbi:MAG: PEGA domain-containing protein [Patescibacteria group bacterium]|jgi:hypothetical protein